MSCAGSPTTRELRGVAYYAPAPFTDGTWDLLLIAVQPDCQRQGRGAALLRHVENALRTSGQRVLLVDTSGLPSYDRARAFYAKCGYEQEARIRDFYKAGDDKVVFRKALNANRLRSGAMGVEAGVTRRYT